jgi:cell wall-associated NlpC family hydrolase
MFRGAVFIIPSRLFMPFLHIILTFILILLSKSFLGNENSQDYNPHFLNNQSKALINILKAQLGKPYKYGGTGPNSFDCSGLVLYVYSNIGIKLPRIAQDQAEVGQPVDRDNLSFGDILFFAKDGKNINHTGIFVGNGKMIHAPQTGDVVKMESINEYYLKNFKKAIRLLY